MLLPGRYIKPVGAKSLSISINAQNLWTITGYKGWDSQTQINVCIASMENIHWKYSACILN